MSFFQWTHRCLNQLFAKKDLGKGLHIVRCSRLRWQLKDIDPKVFIMKCDRCKGFVPFPNSMFINDLFSTIESKRPEFLRVAKICALYNADNVYIVADVWLRFNSKILPLE